MVMNGKGSKTTRAFTAEEITAMRATLADRPRDLSLLDVSVHLGLRASDLLRIEWPWVLATDKTDIRGYLILNEKKTGHFQELPITPPMRVALARWWTLCDHPTSGLVWPSRKKQGVMTADGLNLLVQRWADAAGLHGQFGSHSLRKAFGREFLRANADRPDAILLLMERFKHSSPSVTKRYLGILKEEVDQAAAKMDFTKGNETPKPKPKPQKRTAPRQGPLLIVNGTSSPEPTPEPTPENAQQVVVLRAEVESLREEVAKLNTTVDTLLELVSRRIAEYGRERQP